MADHRPRLRCCSTRSGFMGTRLAWKRSASSPPTHRHLQTAGRELPVRGAGEWVHVGCDGGVHAFVQQTCE